MNLYEIMLEHFSQKDSEKGIYTYLVANSDEEVYEWLKYEQKLKDGRRVFVSYEDYENDGDVFDIYDDKYNVVGQETFKERMIRLKGDLNDEEKELSDLYYGATLIGWKIVKYNITDLEIGALKSLGIAIETR